MKALRWYGKGEWTRGSEDVPEPELMDERDILIRDYLDCDLAGSDLASLQRIDARHGEGATSSVT